MRAAAKHHHNVYVVELSRDVLLEPKFRKSNPDYEPGKPCVYVGMTGLTPDDRFHRYFLMLVKGEQEPIKRKSA